MTVTAIKRTAKRVNSALAATMILLVAVASAVAASFLPDRPYERFQLLDNTVYKNVRWIYERIHFDPRPIDVAIIGSSKSLLGLSAPRMQEDLSHLGKTATVANLSVVASGRNIEWAVVNELYKTKRPKVMVVLIDETPFPYGHMGFKYVAPPSAVAFPPQPFLHNYLYDVSYLPYRQMVLFAASLFPGAFGVTPSFDPGRYAQTRSDYTSSFRGQDGNWVDMDHTVPGSALAADHRLELAHEKHSHVPRSVAAWVEADDHAYMNEIARQAAAHGTRLMFVFIPIYQGALDPENRKYYGRFAPVLDEGDLGSQDRLYSLWPHLNHAGAMILSDRVAATVAPNL